MATDKPEVLFDSRVVERNISRNLISREEYEAWLAKLDDCSERSVVSSTFFQYSGESPAQEVNVSREDVRALQERDAGARQAAIAARQSR